MRDKVSLVTGGGGSGVDGGVGGHGGDINFNFYDNNYGPGSPDILLLMSLPRAVNAGYDSGREDAPTSCLKGTRVAILEEIQTWSESANGERPPVYWLNGLAGIGKSTIAKTVAERAHEKAMLGASFFFSRSDQHLRDPQLVFPTLAFHLAQLDNAFKNVIVEALKQDPTVGHKALPTQLQELISNPLLKINPHQGPILIILDALDECDERGAADILRLVFSHMIRIPFLRILITSRPQPHLSTLFNEVPNLAKTILHDIEASVIQQDIRLYISTELAEIPKRLHLPMPANWAKEVERDSLVEKSGKLFVYAATAIRFIGDDRMRDPRGHLSLVLNTISAQPTGVTPYSQLDDLYMGVLRNSRSVYNHRDILKRFQIVVGSIVLLREPLPLYSLARFVCYETDVVENTLYHLHSVIVPPSHIHEAPRIYHPSFLEFITDASRCSMAEFVIVPVPEQELRHAARCFELMATHLKRDVAGISNSSLLNSEVEGFEQRVRDALPPEVQYACRYWASHLSHVEFGEKGMAETLEVFSMRSILWWFEAMSLVGSISTAASSIQDAHRWAINSKCNGIVITILSDARRFILAHGEVIRESALHVYHSALPFTPYDTALYKVYWEDGNDCIRVLQGLEPEWPQALSTLRGHSGWVRGAAFSPDGLQLASGAADCTLQLWDAVSGAPIAILKGHSGAVTSIAFSPGGLVLASGSGDHTLRLWDVVAGTSILTLEGHSDWVTAVAFSPDGLCLVSSSDDCTLRLWEVKSGTLIAQLQGHSPVTSVAFSPDGLHIASSSYYDPICLWDAVTCVPIATLEGHSASVRTMAFSPDGLHLASGSYDGTLQLWDVKSGMTLAKLDNHSDLVRTVAFSPDGVYLASGSYDHTIWLWDAVSGMPIARLQGHSGFVLAVAFSPDGLHLVSGAADHTLRLWDVMSHIPITKAEGHSDSVLTMVFSPNGLYLASGSDDHTLQLWNAVSGMPIAKLEGHSQSVITAVFAPDGLCLASSSSDGTVQLWNVVSGDLIASLEAHSHWVRTIAFSPDGLHLASGSDDGTIQLWSTQSSRPIAKLEGHSGWVRTVAYSPDGKCLASGSHDHTVQLWHAVSGRATARLEGHSNWVTTVAFSPDGLYLASGSHDCTVRLWNPILGESLFKLEGHSHWVVAVAFSGDSILCTTHAREEVLVWDLASQPPCHLVSGSSSVAPGRSVRSIPLIWSFRDRWIQVERREDGAVRRICRIPPHYTRNTGILVSTQRTHSRIAIGCNDGRVIILTIPHDPFNWRFSEEDANIPLVPAIEAQPALRAKACLASP